MSLSGLGTTGETSAGKAGSSPEPPTISTTTSGQPTKVEQDGEAAADDKEEFMSTPRKHESHIQSTHYITIDLKFG